MWLSTACRWDRGTGRMDRRLCSKRTFAFRPRRCLEFIVQAPSAAVQHASLVTSRSKRARAVTMIRPHHRDDRDDRQSATSLNMHMMTQCCLQRPDGPGPRRFAGLIHRRPAASHVIYFSEAKTDHLFFITVDNQTPQTFGPDNPPALIVQQGTVEEWTIQNRTHENHEFHLHQVHFLTESQSNFTLNGSAPCSSSLGRDGRHGRSSLLGWQSWSSISQH